MNREAVCGRSKRCWYVCVLPALMGHGGCAGAQSALDPAGSGAARISVLFWQMTVGSAVIWLAVVGLALYATYKKSPPERTRHGHWLIVGGGVIAPTVVLAGLLIYGLAMLPPLLAAAPPGSLRVQVSGEQYWWRVRYPGPNGETVELANELRLPVGEATQLELTSPDVIHSFWIPSLGGKVDMIPGRTTQLALHPTRTAELSGACAEFCGTSHAHMGFKAVVLEPVAFRAWLAQQAAPARTMSDPLAARGGELFSELGCPACHAVRGTAARGVLGPDLTHVGSRLTVGAGLLHNEPAQFQRWLQELDALKPGTSMPHFAMLKPDDAQALAAYLEELQ